MAGTAGAEQPEAIPIPREGGDHDRVRLIDTAGSALLRAAIPELPAVNIFGAQEDPDTYAVTCPTPLSNRMRLIWSGEAADHTASRDMEISSHRRHRLYKLFWPDKARRDLNQHKERRMAMRMSEADQSQGHRRMNIYTNYKVKITKDESQMLHPTDDISYRGIGTNTLPNTHICTRDFLDRFTGTLHPDFHRNRKDTTGAPLCQRMDTCWLCSTLQMDQIFSDSAVSTGGTPHGVDSTIGPALQNWLHMSNYTFPEPCRALPLMRRWGGLHTHTAYHTRELIHTSWNIWFAMWNIGEAHNKHFVKLGGVRLPHWHCLKAHADLRHLVVHLEVYRQETDEADTAFRYHSKFQATQDLPDETYAALWNLSLGRANTDRDGPHLTNFDKANAIDMLIGLGRALKHTTPETRDSLYSEFGDMEEMSFFWEVLLNKVGDPAIVDLPRLRGRDNGHDIDTEPATDAEADMHNTVYGPGGETVNLDYDHPLFHTPYMARAIFRSESRTF